MYLKTITEFPNGDAVEDITNFDLADKKGQWHGKCSGSNCTAEALIAYGIKFEESGLHKITFLQHMREEKVEEITGLQFIIYTHEESSSE